MKKIFNGLVSLLVAVLIVSCSSGSNGSGSLLKLIPANADAVMIGDVKTVLASAGGSINGSELSLPKKLLKEFPEVADEYDEVKSDVKNCGLDLEKVAGFANFKNNEVVFIAKVTDSKKLIRLIEDNDYEEIDKEDGVTYFTDKYNDECIAVGKNFVYFVTGGYDVNHKRYLENMIEDAKEANFASTAMGKYIIEGNAAGVAIRFTSEMKREVAQEIGVSKSMFSNLEGICLRGDLSTDKVEVELCLIDENGNVLDNKEFNKYSNTSARINKDALSYMGKDEFMFYAVSLKDVQWEDLVDEVSSKLSLSRGDKAVMRAATDYLSKINGTVALGMGLTNGIESIVKIGCEKDMLEQFSATLVIEVKDNKSAKSLLEDLKGLLESQGIDFDETKTELTVNLKRLTGQRGEVNVKIIDQFIVVANHPIKNGNGIASSSVWNNYAAALIKLDKNNQLMKDLGLKNNVSLSIISDVKKASAKMVLEVEGASDYGVLDKVLNMAINVAKNADDIENTIDNYYRQYRRDYYYDDYYGVAEEEVVAVDSVDYDDWWY